MNSIVSVLIMASAQAGDRREPWPCPDSWSSTRDAVMRGLHDTLSQFDPAVRPQWCDPASELFLAVREDWGADPRDRATRALVVCARDGAETTWSRVSYFRRWPTPLAPSDGPEHARRVPKRLATPRGVRIETGPFPPSAVEDLEGWLGVLRFLELPSEFPSGDVFHDDLGVRIVRARIDDRETMVVAGKFCSQLPAGVDALRAHMLNESDPVEWLESYRVHLHERYDELRAVPPAP